MHTITWRPVGTSAALLRTKGNDPLHRTTRRTPRLTTTLRHFGHTGAAVAMLMLTHGAGRAEVLVDQSAGQTGRYIQSQEFPDLPAYTAVAFDDFTIGTPFNLTSLTVFGRDFYGNPANNLSVVAGIYAAPDLTGAPILCARGVEVRAGALANLVFDFGGATLPAGTYWLGAYIVRPNSQAGWYWQLRLPITRSQAMWHNPGGGFGLGTTPTRLGDVLEESDLAFILNGNPSAPAATATASFTATSTRPGPPATATATNVPASTGTRTATRMPSSPTPTRTRTPTRTATPPGDSNQQGGSGGQGGQGNN